MSPIIYSYGELVPMLPFAGGEYNGVTYKYTENWAGGSFGQFRRKKGLFHRQILFRHALSGLSALEQDYDRIKGSLGPPERIYQFSPNSAITIRDIRLSPSELKVVDLIDGKTNLAGIISSSSLPPLDTSRVLFSLLSLKIIEEVKKEEKPETKPTPMLPLDGVYGLDPVALLELDRKALSTNAIAFLKHIDGRRTLINAIEESKLEKNKAMEGLWELYERGLLKTVTIEKKPPIESVQWRPL
jgi:hypothetical protein